MKVCKYAYRLVSAVIVEMLEVKKSELNWKLRGCKERGRSLGSKLKDQTKAEVN